MSDSPQKKYAHGCLQVNFIGRVVSDPKINSNTDNEGKPFESIFINAVCNPYNGKLDPESVFVGVNFLGSSVALAKMLKKGDEISFMGYIVKAPKIYKGKEGDRVSLEIRGSRDAGSLHKLNRQAAAPKNGESSFTGKTSTNTMTEEDIPF